MSQCAKGGEFSAKAQASGQFLDGARGVNRPIPCAARSALLQVLTNLCQQFARAVGFCDVTVATGRMRFAVVAAQSIGSYGDNRDAF